MSDRNHSLRSSSDGAHLQPGSSFISAAGDNLLSSIENVPMAGGLMRADSAPMPTTSLAPSRLGATRLNNPTPIDASTQSLGRNVSFPSTSNQAGLQQQQQQSGLNYDASPYQAASLTPMGASVGSLTSAQLSQHRQMAAISGIRQRLAQATLGVSSVSTGPRRSTVATISASSLNQVQAQGYQQYLGYPTQTLPNPFAFQAPSPLTQHQTQPYQAMHSFAPSHLTSNQMMPPSPFVGQGLQGQGLQPPGHQVTPLSPQLLAYIGSELARNGVTVASAIESGLLGINLSHEEVEIIVDAHVAEQTKIALMLVEGHSSFLAGNLNPAFATNQPMLRPQQLKPFVVPNFGRGSHDSALSGASGEISGSSVGEIRDSGENPQSGPLVTTTQVPPLFQRKSYQ